MSRIEAVLFDLDGTLVDSHKIVVRSFRTTLDFYNIHLSNEEITTKIRPTLKDSYQEMICEEDIKKFCTKHDEIQGDLVPMMEIFPGVTEALEELNKLKIKLAIVTARTRLTEEIMQATKIKDTFKTVITGNDVTNHKPDPEGIFLALNKLGVRTKNVIMIGDTAPDIRAGKNAGVKTIGVTYGFYGRKVKESIPDYLVDNFTEIMEIVARK